MEDHVGMGYKICPLCAKEHDETVLLATEYKEVKGKMSPKKPVPRRVCMGMKLCEDCHVPGYVVIIEVDETKVQLDEKGRVSGHGGLPISGRMAHVHEAVLHEDFRMLLDDDDDILLCGKQAMDILQEKHSRRATVKSSTGSEGQS